METIDFHSYVALCGFTLSVAFIIYPTQIRFRSYLVPLNYATMPLTILVLFLCTTTLNLEIVWKGMTGDPNGLVPIYIIILFFSLAYICISLDSRRVFEAAAWWALKKAGGNAYLLFTCCYFLSATLTLVTSNDIVILTLTPIICYVGEFTNSDPRSLLMGQFIAANVWSAALYTGNPTNIIVSQAEGVGFAEFASVMAWPAVIGGIVSFLVLFALESRSLKTMSLKLGNMTSFTGKVVIGDKGGVVIGTICLVGSMVGLILAPSFQLPVWIVTFPFALGSFLYDLIKDFRSKQNVQNLEQEEAVDSTEKYTKNTLSKIPWSLLPFLFSLFIWIELLNARGWIGIFATAFSVLLRPPFTPLSSSIIISLLTSVACVILNNQPMTILFTRILFHPNSQAPFTKYAKYALIQGSNYGANLGKVGALAGIMWFTLLKEKWPEGSKPIGTMEFSIKGIVVMIPVVITSASLLSLSIVN